VRVINFRIIIIIIRSVARLDCGVGSLHLSSNGPRLFMPAGYCEESAAGLVPLLPLP